MSFKLNSISSIIMNVSSKVCNGKQGNKYFTFF